jgi:uncharacterized protein (DUF1800 family)
MSDCGVDAIRADIAHLYRRLGFGATADELDALTAAGYEAAVAGLLAPSGADPADSIPVPTFAPYEKPPANPDAATRAALRKQRTGEHKAIVDYWMRRTVTTTHPLREKMTLLWHGHFATSIDKVVVPEFMFRQNQIFRTLGVGRFEDLTLAVAKDPAMLIWLDSNSNVKGRPNENFARELMELFTLGIGNYTEDDVKEAARCFTGWTLNRQAGSFVFAPARHDEGTKTLLGTTGPLTGDDVIHVTSTSSAAQAFIAAKIWSHLAYPVGAADPVVRDLLGWNGDLQELVRSVALHPAFRSPQAKAGLVKQPIEWIAGALRALRVPYDERIFAIFSQLSQIPFAPPSVGGWPQNTYWLTTATALARLNFANRITGLADLTAVSRAGRSDRPGLVANMLSLSAWSDPTSAALHAASGDPQALVALALTAPEYVLN